MYYFVRLLHAQYTDSLYYLLAWVILVDFSCVSSHQNHIFLNNNGSEHSDMTVIHPHLAVNLSLNVRFDPTLCGVYTTTHPPRSFLGGSSPHTWGLRAQYYWEPHSSRFIPTYVGFTFSVGQRGVAESVHPHVRGVYGRFVVQLGIACRFIPVYYA